MVTYLERFVKYIETTHINQSKSKSKSKSKLKLTKNNEYDKLYIKLQECFIKMVIKNYNNDIKYDFENVDLFLITRRGEGITFFIYYHGIHYVFKTIYNIHTDYSLINGFQNKMNKKGLSPKIYNYVNNCSKFADSNPCKLMKKTRLEFILMEYIDSIELGKYYINEVLNKQNYTKSKKELERIVKYMNKFLKNLRNMGICHNDFTLDNILYNRKNKRIYLIDYGWAELYKNNDKCIDYELDFILKSKRPVNKQRIMYIFKKFGRKYSKDVILKKNTENYLELEIIDR